MRPELKLFDSSELDGIIAEAISALGEIGVLIENDSCLSMLQDAGVSIKNGRACFSADEIHTAVASAPSGFGLYDRQGELVSTLGKGALLFAPGSAALHILDSKTGRHRSPTVQDCTHLAWVTEACGSVNLQATALIPRDVAESLADSTRLAIALANSNKPVVTGTFSKDGFDAMRAMLIVVRGDADALREKPLAIFDCAPTSPLKWSDLTSDALIQCARAGIPVEIVSMPLAGATSPVTLRDTLIQFTAENLSGVVCAQIANSGAPVIWACSVSVMDMRYGTTPMGSMEAMMMAVAAASIGRHLGLPTHAYLALSDSKTSDWQAGAETGIGAGLAALGMLDVISGPGMLNFQLTQSLEKLVLDNEACAMAMRLSAGIGAGYAGATVDLLSEVVATGHFLKAKHTRQNFRKELSFPGPAIFRESYETWTQRGAQSAQERAGEEVTRILNEGNPAPLDEEKLSALKDIMLNPTGS